jgi:hypothetical protein
MQTNTEREQCAGGAAPGAGAARCRRGRVAADAWQFGFGAAGHGRRHYSTGQPVQGRAGCRLGTRHLWRQTSARWNASDATLRASAASLGDVQVSIAAEVALSYITLRAAQARLAIAEANLASQLETHANHRQWRLQAGLVSSLEAEQSLSATRTDARPTAGIADQHRADPACPGGAHRPAAGGLVTRLGRISRSRSRRRPTIWC